MKSRIIGEIIIGIGILIGFIVYSFNKALADIVAVSCSHGPSCPMYGTIALQTNISLGIIVMVILIGAYIIFFMKDMEILKEYANEKKKKINLSKLNIDEKKVYNLIKSEEGSMYQSDIVKETGLSKVKITRTLDKLTGKNIIERHRRGMTNIIILK